MNLIKDTWQKKDYQDFLNYLFNIKEEKELSNYLCEEKSLLKPLYEIKEILSDLFIELDCKNNLPAFTKSFLR